MLAIFLKLSSFLFLADGAGRFRIKTYRVTVNVQDRYVRTEVAVHVKNNMASDEFYNFGVELDNSEFISSLTMRVAKREWYFGNVYARQTAQQIFQNATDAGLTTGIISGTPDKDPLKDPTKTSSFSTTVSVPAGEAAFFWLIYEKQLERTREIYEYSTPVLPYDPVEEFELRINIMESRALKATSVTFENKLEIIELEKTVNNAKSVSYSYSAGLGEPAPRPNGRTKGLIKFPEYGYYSNFEDKVWNIVSDCDQVIVKSTFFELESNYDYLYIDGVVYTGTRNVEIDQLVGKVFTVRFTSDYSVVNQGFNINWECAGASNMFDGGVTIKYDVERPANIGGDILVRDGYFIHFISPNLLPISKNIIFVIDKSGSMRGARMDQTKRAFESILNGLNDDDYFQLITFDSYVRNLYPDFQPVTAATKADAIGQVRNLQASGGTNLLDGMMNAVTHRNGQNSANIIVLISDGRPNGSWINIREQIKIANDGYFEINSFAIGSSAPIDDLKMLSRSNNGKFEHILDDTIVEVNLNLFYEDLANPTIWNAKFLYRNAKNIFMSSHSLFFGRELVIIGELKDRCASPEPICNEDMLINADIQSFCSGVQEIEFDCRVLKKERGLLEIDDRRYLANPKVPMTDNIDLKKYYAYAQMNDWFTTYESSDNIIEKADMETKITGLSVEEGFVTEFTSMVVVEDPEMAARRLFEEAEDIPQPKENSPAYKLPKQPKKPKIRQRRSASFQKELQDKFANKAVEDLKKLERSRRGVQIELPQTGKSFATQSLTFKFILPAICLLLVLSKSKIAKGLRRMYR